MDFSYETDFTRAGVKLLVQRINQSEADHQQRGGIALFDTLYDLKYLHHQLSRAIQLCERFREYADSEEYRALRAESKRSA